ncbi:helix-turn-helix domain-containing protein [Altererythrobacter lutimaris]|uniref:Helix-turn-helix domain-containing protein n=1 Tax=Altererythrobacter lutimaris TaxID=2743979 RepID=A0A850HIL9_9SPHN|nr:helix-turn-helix domain-containing protein [Altererythrobacter lutimaris]NVE95522.1 helix-turn-helix domain-containing protein [Altererythrobacter lutimaris]
MDKKPASGSKHESLDALDSRSGTSTSGLPLSVNREPSDGLRPWVARLVAARIETEADHTIVCGMCNDLAYQRLVQRGRWTAQSKDGHDAYQDEALLFGPHSKYMPLTCTGPVVAIGVGLRPGALTRLADQKAPELLDRIVRGDPLGLIESDMASEYPASATPDQWIAQLEARLRLLIEKLDPEPPDPVSTAFERAAFLNPNIAPGDVAEEQGISLRQLERIVKRDFGLSPKKVLRRARALDLAAQLCGVADEAEEQELLLRYFDQSHLIREFQAFFANTPAAFRSTPHPLMTINLETRQARRLEILNRIMPGERRPWEAE